MLHFSLSLMNRLKLGLQFSFLYFGLVAIEGSTFTRLFLYNKFQGFYSTIKSNMGNIKVIQEGLKPTIRCFSYRQVY